MRSSSTLGIGSRVVSVVARSVSAPGRCIRFIRPTRRQSQRPCPSRLLLTDVESNERIDSSTEASRSRAGHGRGSSLTLGGNDDRMSFPVEAFCRGSALVRESTLCRRPIEGGMIFAFEEAARSAVSRLRGHAVVLRRGDFLPRPVPGTRAPEVGGDSTRFLLRSAPQPRARPNKAPEPRPRPSCLLLTKSKSNEDAD